MLTKHCNGLWWRGNGRGNNALPRRLLPIAHHPSRQGGVVLFITLIVLVAMTMAGIALVRSVSTTNMIAGNIAFQQGATHSSDLGVETAITWLETNTGVALQGDNLAMGYVASLQDPVAGQTWDNFWANQLVGRVRTLNPDTSGNTPAYVIQRMCNSAGLPTAPATGCASSPVAGTPTCSKSTPPICLNSSSQVYYRITARVAGPRNTVSFVQAIVAM